MKVKITCKVMVEKEPEAFQVEKNKLMERNFKQRWQWRSMRGKQRKQMEKGDEEKSTRLTDLLGCKFNHVIQPGPPEQLILSSILDSEVEPEKYVKGTNLNMEVRQKICKSKTIIRTSHYGHKH
ncbi:hypothetical protein H6P81_014812 [Aristolochia fimbriata]|uniref:Uncharacterized protein n=1 Tax=Aristolochia fimbriata TaxID=158543 RepID=A0AAV7E7K7_ARIFI|nr:hypothetical protein H6P81_014812 [Aristolochia fimbriata]